MPQPGHDATHECNEGDIEEPEMLLAPSSVARNAADGSNAPGTYDKLFATLAKYTGQIVWVRDAAGLVTWDVGWSTYTGQTSGSAIELRWLNTVHPDDVTRTVQAWAQSLATQQPYEVEQRLLRADGVYRLFRSRAAPVFNDDGSMREWVGISIDITENAELATQKEEARASEFTAWALREDAHRRLLATLESISDCFVALTRDFRIMYLNEVAEQTLGANRGEYVGHMLWEKSPALVGTEVERACRRALHDHTPVAVTAFIPASERWMEVRAYPSADGLALYYRDVTAAKRIDAASLRREQDLDALFEHAPSCVIFTDANGYILRTNSACCELLGYTRAELLGRSLADFGAPDAAAVIAWYRTRYEAPETSPGVQARRFRRKGGSIVHASASVVEQTDAQGKVIGAIHMVEDITELRELQRAVAHMRIELSARETLYTALDDRVPAAEQERWATESAQLDVVTTIELVGTANGAVTVDEAASRCPSCGEPLINGFFVNPAAEVVGCPACARERHLAGRVLTHGEWLGVPKMFAEVLNQFGLHEGARLGKPALSLTLRPRSHSWEVSTPDGAEYVLRRFSAWFPDEALLYQHDLLAHVASQGL